MQSTTSVVIQIEDHVVFGAILQIQEVLGNIVIQLDNRGKRQKTTTSVHTMDFNFNTKRWWTTQSKENLNQKLIFSKRFLVTTKEKYNNWTEIKRRQKKFVRLARKIRLNQKMKLSFVKLLKIKSFNLKVNSHLVIIDFT